MAASGDIDLGIVILPHAYHANGINTLLEAGVHVITEKPFAIKVADCDEAIALAKLKEVVLSVYHNRHWDPDVVTLLHVIDSGLLGEVYSLECNMFGRARPGVRTRRYRAGHSTTWAHISSRRSCSCCLRPIAGGSRSIARPVSTEISINANSTIPLMKINPAVCTALTGESKSRLWFRVVARHDIGVCKYIINK